MFNKMEKNMFEKKENKMFKVPATVAQAGMSPSRTYMIGVYDPVSPNEIRFERVTLPEPMPNSIRDAKTYYLYYILDNILEAKAIRIMACISIEEYIRATHNVLVVEKENIEVPFNMFYDRNTKSEKEDIEITLKMLFDWNVNQKKPSISYSGALNILLERIALVDDLDNRLVKLKEMALEILQIE